MRKKSNGSPKVTIVMYHYVRDMARTRYPDLKALDSGAFLGQIRYFLKHYSVIRMEELLEAVTKKKKLPENALLLTFDDGYKDHVEFVFPVLNKFGIQGSFFVPVEAVSKHKVLDVNKIHFILASVSDKEKILADMRALLKRYKAKYKLKSEDEYLRLLVAEECRYDTKEVVFIKRMLQRELPEKFRTLVTDVLFRKYVTEDEASFARELYLNSDDIKRMRDGGMYIGSHGYNHYWLNTLTPKRQQEEIKKSLVFLQGLRCSQKPFAFCYPYGAYNDSLLKVLEKAGCAVAVTTRVSVADIATDNPLLLPRLDTNDFPKTETSSNKMTRKTVMV
ncbi:MAG: polysaccharide deacetylase family protein [bacterium]|nr:polysaccharide deacetylase family protein [bacterium]